VGVRVKFAKICQIRKHHRELELKESEEQKGLGFQPLPSVLVGRPLPIMRTLEV